MNRQGQRGTYYFVNYLKEGEVEIDIVSPCEKLVFVVILQMKKRCERSICPNGARKQFGEVLVVIGAFESPHDGPGGTSLPIFHSATRDGGESRPISANEAHALGLDNGIDNDGIPVKQRMSFEDKKKRKEKTNHMSYWAIVLE